MPAGELNEWGAYERVWGSLLPHERIDSGFAQLSYLLVKLLYRGRRNYSTRDFMPGWFRDLTADQVTRDTFMQLREMARADD